MPYGKIQKVESQKIVKKSRELFGSDKAIVTFSIVYTENYGGERTAKFAIKPNEEFLFKPMVSYIKDKIGQNESETLAPLIV